jgi:hypothetical protein
VQNSLSATNLIRIFQSGKHLTVAEDFFQKEKDRGETLSSPFSPFFNTLSYRPARNGPAFLCIFLSVGAAFLHLKNRKSAMSDPNFQIFLSTAELSFQ